MTWFTTALADLPAADEDARRAVLERAAQVLRPAGALRRLDEVAAHVAAWQGTPTPSIDRPAVLVFAGDHGVVAAGVSAYPSEITAEMLRAVQTGRATINAMARSVGATLDVFDVGVGRPTGDIRLEPALTPDRLEQIATLAADAVDVAVAGGADLLVLGELGIGNTTISAALPAALLGGGAAQWVGPGAGVDGTGLERKRTAIDEAVARVRSIGGTIDDPIEIMRQIGGSELAAMAAACARARRHRLPIVLDGYVATAAVLPLQQAAPGALDHCLVGHLSAEPGHRLLLDHLGLEPLLDLEMRLGEGSGALAAVPLVRMACPVVTEVATIDEWFGS